MYVIEVDSADAMFKKAQLTGIPVKMLRAATAVPVTVTGGGVELQSAVVFRYTLNVPSEGVRTYQEVLLADPQGMVKFTGTLWQRLIAANARVEIIERSGSI